MGVKSSNQATYQEADGRVYLPHLKVFEFEHSDLDAGDDLYLCPIPAGSILRDVTVHVAAAFDNGADLNVGDSAAADTYIAAADIDPTVLNTLVSSRNTGQAGSAGKHYAANDYLLFAFTANPAAGKMVVAVEFLRYGPSF